MLESPEVGKTERLLKLLLATVLFSKRRVYIYKTYILMLRNIINNVMNSVAAIIIVVVIIITSTGGGAL
jgi:hypothetical protein